MTARELLRAVRRVVGAVELAGMDVVEVSPPYDQSEVTAMLAYRVVMEALSSLAARRGYPWSNAIGSRSSSCRRSTRCRPGCTSASRTSR